MLDFVFSARSAQYVQSYLIYFTSDEYNFNKIMLWHAELNICQVKLFCRKKVTGV